MHYVIGDVHGCYNEFISLRNKIESKDPMFNITFVGDIIDRGPDCWYMIDWAVNNIPNSMKYHCVLGNHEEMIIDWYDHEKKRGAQSLKDCLPAQYGFNYYIEEKLGNISFETVGSMIDVFRNFPLYRTIKIKDSNKNIRKYVIAHAGAPLDTFGEIDRKGDRDEFLWSRDHLDGFDTENISDYILVHGHTPTFRNSEYIKEQQGKIGYKPNCINVDTGCVFKSGHLGAICLETLEETYS